MEDWKGTSMRFSLLTIMLTASLACAADQTNATYVDGNVEGWAANAPVSLELRDTKTMVLHANKTDVEIAYAGVSKADSTAVAAPVVRQPLYKVWNLPKRVMPPAAQEKLVVKYSDRVGAAKSATLLVSKELADQVIAQVTATKERAQRDAGVWWGDQYWKTKRNQNQWGGAGTVAQRE
jgi:hypothetical protein